MILETHQKKFVSTISHLEIEYISKEDVISQVSKALDHSQTVEITFTKRPPPREFRELLTELTTFYTFDRLFLSEEDSVIAGTLFNINLSRPRRAVIEIANGCNLKCDFCWTHSPLNDQKPSSDWLKKKIDASVVFRYIDDLSSFQTVRLLEFCAIGDPLYHPQIWEFIEYAKIKGLKVRLSTNGTLLYPDKWLNHCVGTVDELFMNISAGDRQVYSDIHNVPPRIFDQLMKNLEFIDSWSQRTGTVIQMHWINIMTEKNLEALPSIVTTGLEHGANYFDFRNVWIHKPFQKSLKISEGSYSKNRDHILSSLDHLTERKVANNLGAFINELDQKFAISG